MALDLHWSAGATALCDFVFFVAFYVVNFVYFNHVLHVHLFSVVDADIIFMLVMPYHVVPQMSN